MELCIKHSYKPQLHWTFSMNSNKPEKQTWHLDGDVDLLEANFMSQEVFLKREPAVRIQQLQLVRAALTYRRGCWSRRGCSKHCMLAIGLCKQSKGSVQEGNPRLPGPSVLTNSDKNLPGWWRKTSIKPSERKEAELWLDYNQCVSVCKQTNSDMTLTLSLLSV